MNQLLKIEALDTLFFRDGKPFTMGDDTYAEGIFPPLPSTIYGALRTAYFSENKNDLPLANTVNDPTKDLKITGIYYGLQNKTAPFLPLPLDMVERKDKTNALKKVEKNNKHYEVVSLQLSRFSLAGFSPTDLDTPANNSQKNEKKLLVYQQGKVKVENLSQGLLSLDVYGRYLKGRFLNRKTEARKIGDYVKTEYKIGIGRNNHTRVSEEGHLYRLGMKRLGELELYVSYSFGSVGKKLSSKGLAKLGGEWRTIHYHSGVEVNNFQLSTPSILNFNTNTNPNPKATFPFTFKLVLTTPSIFENGWYPNFIDNKNVRLVAACVGKPLAVGGFDMKAKRPKPMFRAVPAGSVYYLEVEKEADLRKIQNRTSICEEPLTNNSFSIPYSNQGYGLFELGLIGK